MLVVVIICVVAEQLQTSSSRGSSSSPGLTQMIPPQSILQAYLCDRRCFALMQI